MALPQSLVIKTEKAFIQEYGAFEEFLAQSKGLLLQMFYISITLAYLILLDHTSCKTSMLNKNMRSCNKMLMYLDYSFANANRDALSK